ncbi:AbrB/MazE/SpoVT family DNA-binding domain-containing protein [Arthrobacter sp. Br18]|uniref:AbrB/MazE/SpoVT family DNA-binding domain-containing protein n=1 Tax=Arthrobacter sp. Br18 TaxID=1312954 RepID=UPI00047DB93C|nr:AbrB/MazE/SpoVT family DNA-binding domain-containing protein [Arthrobacter sp. Br18]
MVLAKVTSKGQVTIPLEVRRKLALETGSRIDFVLTAEGKYAIEPITRSVGSLEGIFHQEGLKAVSLDDMQDAITAEAGKSTLNPVPGPA